MEKAEYWLLDQDTLYPDGRSFDEHEMEVERKRRQKASEWLAYLESWYHNYLKN